MTLCCQILRRLDNVNSDLASQQALISVIFLNVTNKIEMSNRKTMFEWNIASSHH